MKRVSFFRWVVVLGLLLIGCSIAVYWHAPEYPELEQIDLTVLDEEPDGTCTVRWTDPFGDTEREAPYLCDADRDPVLKAPEYRPGTNLGWDTGFVVAEGENKGELYTPELDGTGGRWVDASDLLVTAGVLVTFVGVVGGTVQSLYGLSGLDARTVRRAERLRDMAAQVARDHERAVEAVRDAWTPLHEERVRKVLEGIPVGRLRWSAGPLVPVAELPRHGIRSVQDVLDAGAWGITEAAGLGQRAAEKVWEAARRKSDAVAEDTWVRLDTDPSDPGAAKLLTALRVLVEAGPEARSAAEEGRRLADVLDRRLAAAAPASGWRLMLDTDRDGRLEARAAMARLREVLAEAERAGLRQRFAQASVDLLRGADADPLALSARVDLASRPDAYQKQLWHITRTRLAESAALTR
ncbi:hypothetical protein [Streptomyces sp. GESEQ-13]|uniref:hypothetical protein n=1 Tax=Streptomyces sp. GESEQ-13 TaxID=2812654 RepID=UPI001B335F00